MYQDYANIYESELNGLHCGLCDRAISVLLSAFVSDCPAAPLAAEISLTPIEQIFAIAYFAIANKAVGNVAYPSNYSFGKVPLSIELDSLEAQRSIDVGEKHYVVDFLFTSKVLGIKGIVFELDGYDYHSTKDQMNRDYERERNLQKAGYRVMRFTGSQIYRTPFKCANDAIELIVDCLGEAVER